MTVTVNREVFLHPDFRQDISETLCDYLNSLIDAELEKEEADFDFIDECASAINYIREGFVEAVVPVISRKEFLAKLGLGTVKISKAFAAAIAAAIMLVAGNSAIAAATDYNIIEEVVQKITEIISKTEEETTPAPVTENTATQAPTTARQKKEESIAVEFGESFKTEYNVGEAFDTQGIKIYLIYDDGSKKELEARSCKITASPSFGKAAGYETVTVSYGGFEQSFKVRVLNTGTTPLLTSIYGVFPEDYDFTAKDLSSIDLSIMQVYAVYSDGMEKEISPDDYAVDITDVSTLFEKKALVTVSFEGCSCSFTVFRE